MHAAMHPAAGENTNVFLSDRSHSRAGYFGWSQITLPDLKPTFVYDLPTNLEKNTYLFPNDLLNTKT